MSGWLVFLTLVSSALFGFARSTLVTIDEASSAKYLNGDFFAIVLFHAEWNEQCVPALGALKKVSQMDWPDYVVFGEIDAYSKMKLAARHRVDDYCSLRYFVRGSIVAESFGLEITAQNLERLVRSTMDEVLTEEFLREPLLHLDDTNFERIVRDSRRDVMVLFSTKWCAACAKLITVFEEVAQTLQNRTTCKVAVLDGDEAPVSSFNAKVGVYPSVIFYSKQNKDGDIVRPGKHNEGWTTHNVTRYLTRKCRLTEFIKNAADFEQGRIPALDETVRQFLAGYGKHAIHSAVHYIHSLPSKEEQRRAHYYVDVMEKIVLDGMDFVHEEMDRVEHVLTDPDSISDDIVRQRNILLVFQKTLSSRTPVRDEL